MRTVAEYDVEEEHRRRGIVALLLDPLAPHGAVDHGMRPADGEHVLAEIDDPMALAAARHPRRDFAEGGGEQPASLPRQCSSRVHAADEALRGRLAACGVTDEAVDLGRGRRELDG